MVDKIIVLTLVLVGVERRRKKNERVIKQEQTFDLFKKNHLRNKLLNEI